MFIYIALLYMCVDMCTIALSHITIYYQPLLQHICKPKPKTSIKLTSLCLFLLNLINFIVIFYSQSPVIVLQVISKNS